MVCDVSAIQPSIAVRLTDDGLDLGDLEELLGSVDVEVGDTDRSGQAFLDELESGFGRSLASERRAHLLHGLPRGRDVVGQGDVELDLALRVSDDVVPRGADSLGRIDLEVDLRVSAELSVRFRSRSRSRRLTFQCIRYRSR